MAELVRLNQLEAERHVEEDRPPNRFRLYVGLGILGAVVIFLLGFVIGYFATKAGPSESPAMVPTSPVNVLPTTSPSESPAMVPTSPVNVLPTTSPTGKGDESKYKQLHEMMVDSLTAENVEEFSR